jgi:prolyl 4-hydroxylase
MIGSPPFVLQVLMYLSTPEEGGETVFPYAEERVSGPGWSDCALQGLALHPQRGDALMFYRCACSPSHTVPAFSYCCPPLMAAGIPEGALQDLQWHHI